MSDTPGSLRRAPRDSTFLMADFRRVDSNVTENVRVRNLSAGGMMVDIGSQVEPGTPVEADLRGIGWIRGRVAWSLAGRAGVAFNEPINPLLARKPISTGTQTPDYAKAVTYAPRSRTRLGPLAD